MKAAPARYACGILLAVGGLLWTSTALWPKVTALWPYVPQLQASAFIGGILAVFGLALLVKARRAFVLLVVLSVLAVVVPRVGNINWFAPDPSVRVMSFNTYFGRASVDDIASTIDEVRPDVLSLLETNPEEVHAVSEATGFLPMNDALPGGSGAGGTVLLGNPDGRLASLVRTATEPLAEETGLTTFQMPSLWLPSWHSPGSRAGALDDQQVRIAGAHAVAPMDAIGRQTWDRELEALSGWASTQDKVGNAVLMGDFNATRWHPRMRDFPNYRDCTGHAAARPTWPSSLPVIRIDHILTTGRCGDAGTEKIDGSDHLAVWADISFEQE